MSVNYSPGHFGLLEVDPESNGEFRGVQIIQALGQMFVREPFGALQFDDEFVFDQQIGEVLTHNMLFVHDRETNLSPRRNPSKLQFLQHGAFIDFFQEPASQRIRNLVRSADNPSNQFTFIHVH